MRGFVGSNGRVYSPDQRCAMFAKQKMNMSEKQELNLSDIIASVVHESKKEYMGIEEKPVVTIHRPDMNIVTGSKSGGSIAHLHFRRSEPIKEGLVYNMNNNGVAGASYSYDVY
jgi:hypothetical protein